MKRPKWVIVHQVLVVEALDWQHYGEQLQADQGFEPIRACVIGRVMAVDDLGVALAHQTFHRQTAHAEARQVTAIPWGCILSVAELVARRGER